MTDTATEPGTIDGSTESLRGLEKMGQSLATLHEENAASLAETTVVVPQSDAVIEQVVPTRTLLYVIDLVGGPSQVRVFDHQGLGEMIWASQRSGLPPDGPAYIDAVAQAASLEDAATALAAEAKVETYCAETARAFSEDAGSFANQMADVRQTERLGEFEQGE